MTPDVITQIETNPVEVIDELLRATDGDTAEALLTEVRRLVNNKHASRGAARHVALTLHTRTTDNSIALTKTELAERVDVTPSAISQTVKRIEERVQELRSEFGRHPLLTYIQNSVGRIARISDLPTWIQRVITVHPSPLDDSWGTPADIAQVMSRIALAERRLTLADLDGGEPSELWITPDGEPLTDALDHLTEQITVNGSVQMNADELAERLLGLDVPRQRQRSVVTALTQNKNIIWLPSVERYVAFERPATSHRKSRGNAPKRVTDIIDRVGTSDLASLTSDIVEQFVVQHGLLRATAENAVRGRPR